MESTEFQAKYQKLATEYSKLRAQNQVLKKAVIEEQCKATQLKETLKSKDQSLRKVEQEIDSLNFRNQQLTKRLVLLQEDLDLLQNKSSKFSSKNEPVSNATILNHNVYAEELESKIEENAKLHSEISDIESFYKNKIVELENNLQEAVKNSVKNAEFNKCHELLLQKELKKKETERAQREADIVSLQNEMHDLRKLKDVPKSPNGSLTFNDGKVPNLSMDCAETSSLSLEPDSPSKVLEKLCRRKLITALVEPIGQLSESFVLFFNSYSDLLKNSSSLTVIQSKYMNQLTGENFVWENISKQYKELAKNVEDLDDFISLGTLQGLEAFSKSVENFSSSLRKLLPILCEKLYFKEDQIDAPWRNSLGSLVGCFAAITPYLSSLAAHSDSRTILSSSAIFKILSLLRNRLSKLCSASQELFTAWELLSVHGNVETKITSSLSTISEAFNKIYSLFSENVSSCVSQGSSCASTPSSTYSIGASNASTSNFPILSSPDNVGWSSNMNEGHHLADSEASLAQQLAQALSRLTKLEEEREHWRLEYQLLKHKYDRDLKKSQNLEKKIESPNDKLSQQSGSVNQANINFENATPSTSLVGQVISVAPSSEEREKEIRTHFTTRCSHLYMQLTSCTSQAALYQNECETLMRRLAVCDDNKSSLEMEVDVRRKEVSEVQEVLATTSRNYEEQISTMSEHLADLNEKIANQADLIEHLRFESKKKGKNVVK